jgi:hypothetical protein
VYTCVCVCVCVCVYFGQSQGSTESGLPALNAHEAACSQGTTQAHVDTNLQSHIAQQIATTPAPITCMSLYLWQCSIAILLAAISIVNASNAIGKSW